MKKTEYRDLAYLKHCKKVVEKYSRLFHSRPLTEMERQLMALWESKIEDEYKKPCRPIIPCDGSCNPSMMSYDMDCSVHGWAPKLR